MVPEGSLVNLTQSQILCTLSQDLLLRSILIFSSMDLRVSSSLYGIRLKLCIQFSYPQVSCMLRLCDSSRLNHLDNILARVRSTSCEVSHYTFFPVLLLREGR